MPSLIWKRFRVLAVLTVLASIGGPAHLLAADLLPWPHTAEGLTPDSAWVYGRLDNGLRYVVRQNALPAKNVSLRFCVQVGTSHETPNERGLAHFVEHMAFNGTTHFPGETLVRELRKHGVDIGPELSAFTFLTHTIYNLDAPSTAPEALDRWFTVLRDFADGLQFDPKEVKRERGVIASELRDHHSPDWRADVARRNFLYPRSPLSNDLRGSVSRVDAKQLRAFYDKWYRPDRMIVVAVGDAEPAQLETLVRKHFASLQPRTPPPPRFDPALNLDPAKTTHFHRDRRVSNVSVGLVSVLPRTPDSFDERRRWTARNLAMFIMNNRLRQVMREFPARFGNLDASSGYPTPFSTEISVAFAANTWEWYVGTATIEQELRRSLEQYFTAEEIREAQSSMLTNAEQELAASATIHSSHLANNAFVNAHWGFVSTAPEANLKHTRDWLQQMDAAEINREWRAVWPRERPLVFAKGRMPMRKAEAAIDKAINESRQIPLTAAVEKTNLEFAYTDFGPAGEIVDRSYVPELDLHLLQFANGVKANLKRTTFEASTVYLTTRFGGGVMSEPPDRAGLSAFTASTFLNGGLGKHSADELRRLLSSSALGVNFSTSGTAFELDGRASTPSLERLLQLVTANLTDPAWTEEAAALAITQLNIHYYNLAYTPEGVLSQNVFRVLAGGDSRYATPTLDELKTHTITETKEWFGRQLTSSPLEVGLVGDFDIERAIVLLSRTVGALPPRGPATPIERPVKLSKVAASHRFKFQGEAKRTGLQILWPVEGCSDARLSRQAEVMNSILNSRLFEKVREDLGAAYSPSVSFWKSDVDLNDGYLIAYLSVKPRQAKRITELMLGIADSFSREGATQEEFERALAPILARAATEQNENGYWLWHIIPRAQTRPEVLQWPLTRPRDLQTMTLDDINALAATVLPASRAIKFSAVAGRN